VESVVRFLAPGLAADEAVVGVLTAPHLAQLEAALADAGFAVDDLRARGRLHLFDAGELLPHLLVDGQLDPERFRTSVGRMVVALTDGGAPLRVFGEMVALLWDQGNLQAVLDLEGLWNELLETRPFPLYCAYPMRAFDREETEAAFHEMCGAHTVVLPSERISELPTADARSRAIAVLQHEAIIGINERVALRQSLEEQEAELRRLRALDRLRIALLALQSPPPRTAAPARGRGRGPLDLEAFVKTACRQVRAVLGAHRCTFAPATVGEVAPVGSGAPAGSVAPVGGEGRHITVPVTDGAASHGVLEVELPPERFLDHDEQWFLEAVVATMAVGFATPR
jgi:hypothetical protein